MSKKPLITPLNEQNESCPITVFGNVEGKGKLIILGHVIAGQDAVVDVGTIVVEVVVGKTVVDVVVGATVVDVVVGATVVVVVVIDGQAIESCIFGRPIIVGSILYEHEHALSQTHGDPALRPIVV